MEIAARRDACNANASQRQRRTESRRFAHPDINVYLNSLIRAEIISDFTTSRFGRLVVFINDGDTGINFYDLTFDGKLFFGLFRFMHPTPEINKASKAK